MNRTELEKIYKKHIHGYLDKNRMARFEDVPTRIFIDAMEEALSIANVVGRSEQLKAFAEMVARDDFAYLKDAETLLKDFERL